MFLSSLFLIFFATIASADCNPAVNELVNTYIDVSSQLVIVTNKVKVTNKCNEPINDYLFIVDPQWMHNLSYIEASDDENNILNVNRVYTDNTWLKYEIQFSNSLFPGASKTIKVSSIMINYLQSYPKKVKQNDLHFVLFSFNVYYYSQYFTEKQTSFLYLGTTKVESVDGAKYEISSDTPNALQYGPYSDIEQMSESPSIIHFENKSPFLTVKKLDRFIRISHWGYLTIWEHISLVHTGPKFEGPFERVKSAAPDTRIESFVTTLPWDAFDVYLKDDIGLISSYEIDNSYPDKLEVLIKPRFVMYGGWQTQYEIGYTIPISNYVFYNSEENTFTLNIPVVDKIFPKMIIEDAKISVILPEGAGFQLINPYVTLENTTDKRHCYFMDIICREVVSFQRHNLVEQHGTIVSLTYSYHQLLLFTKPLVFAAVVLAFFLAHLIFFSGSKPTPTKQKTQLQMVCQSSSQLSTPAKQDKKKIPVKQNICRSKSKKR